MTTTTSNDDLALADFLARANCCELPQFQNGIRYAPELHLSEEDRGRIVAALRRTSPHESATPPAGGPGKATPEMVKAAYDKYDSEDIFKIDCDDWLEAVINAALAASPATPQAQEPACREALEKIAVWADLKDPEQDERLSGEECMYGEGVNAGLRSAGQFARAALSSPANRTASPGGDGAHYLSAIRRRLEQLYDASANNPRLREQLSDEIDWVDVQIEEQRRGPTPPANRIEQDVGIREKALRDEIFCLREVVRGVRIMSNAGALSAFEGQPWLRRAQNIDLNSDPCASLPASGRDK